MTLPAPHGTASSPGASPFRVVFDSQTFCTQAYGGISRYFSSLAEAMGAMDGLHPSIIAPVHINSYLPALPAGLVRGLKMRSGHGLNLMARSISKAGFLAQLLDPPDIVHWTYYYFVPRPPRRTRSVLTVFDMIHERHPEEFPRDDPTPRLKREAIARADHVICISERTRQDLLELLPVSPAKVSVTHLAHDAFLDAAGTPIPQPVGEPYLLYVGQRAGYKNFDGLLAAYASSTTLSTQFQLVCFGGGGFSADEQSRFSEAGVAGRLRHVAGGDGVLAACYRGATALVYPSRYEGFGIPVLEAMSLGCAVVCSNAGSLPEVAGDAAAYFAPGNPAEMRHTLEHVLGSQSARADLVARGLERSAGFSWARCARETVAIYRGLIQ